MYVRKSFTTAALALSMVLGFGGAAWASPPDGAPATAQTPLPDGWKITTTTSGPQLTWIAPKPVPVGNAMVEFYAGDRLLGRPRPSTDQRGFRLDLDGIAVQKLTGLQVRAGGRRLDVPKARPDSTARKAPERARAAAARPPANSVDPGKPGPYKTVSGEYALPDVRLPGFAKPVEMKGVVVAPTGVSGQRPLALFLHGRHTTCYKSGSGSSFQWPCPNGWTSVPSYHGYLQAQKLLASQGYVTVSISANGINGQDAWLAEPSDGGAQGRSSLVRHHLAHWADWAVDQRANAPAIVRSAPPADMAHVLLVGHSRGGEGVSRAAMDSLNPPPANQNGFHKQVRWRVNGVALIGPTIFGQNPTPDVPSMTILPSCDGDLSDLQGQLYVDGTRGVSHGSALHSAVFVEGANHNYFNTEWTPGQTSTEAWDDYDGNDPICRSGADTRLSYQQQQTAGATYIAAAARLFAATDDRVRPLLDGSGVRAPSADPASVLSHAVGGNRTPLLTPDPSVTVTGNSARLCEQVPTDSRQGCLYHTNEASPHFTRFMYVKPESGRHAVALNWSQPGTRSSLRPAAPVSVAGAESLALRVIVPADSTGTRLEVAVTDVAGRRASLGEISLNGLRPKSWTAAAWGQEARVPLSGASAVGVDLNRVAALELVPRGNAGKAWLVDAWAWRSGSPYPRPTALPRVDLSELTVDDPEATYQFPARVSGTGTGTGQLRVFVKDPNTGVAAQRLVTVVPGSGTVNIPVNVTGIPGRGDQTYLIAAKAVRGVTVGDAFGALRVRDNP